MPTRRSLQECGPAMPMTGTGTKGDIYAQPDQMLTDTESPQTRRRRIAPAVGMPEPQPSVIQQLIAMLGSNQ